MPRKRKPLGWVSTEFGDFPDCGVCLDWVTQPLMAEAIASVGLDRGGIDVHRLVDQFHANGHREDSDG